MTDETQELLDLVKHYRKRAEQAEEACDRLESTNKGLRLTLATVYEQATEEGVPAGQRLFNIEEETKAYK
jgi:hypothetical protein